MNFDEKYLENLIFRLNAINVWNWAPPSSDSATSE
jgi:hypothetical protein